DDPRNLRHRDPVVHSAHRDHAHRAPGAVDQLDVLRQEVVHPVLINGVGVAAADLHHLVLPAGLDDGTDLRRERAPQIGIAVFVDEFHAAASVRTDPPESRRSATPACTSNSSPGATGATRSVSTSTGSSPSSLAFSLPNPSPPPLPPTTQSANPWSPTSTTRI